MSNIMYGNPLSLNSSSTSYSTFPSIGSSLFSGFGGFNSVDSSIFSGLNNTLFRGGIGNNIYTVGNPGYMGGLQWHTGTISDEEKETAIESMRNGTEVTLVQDEETRIADQTINSRDAQEHAETLSITDQCNNLMRVTRDRRPDQVLEQFDRLIETLKKDPIYQGLLKVDENGNEDDSLIRSTALDLFEKQQGISLVDAVYQHCPGQFESRADATGSFGGRPRISSDEVVAELTGVPYQDKPGERFFGNVCGGLGVIIGHGWLW